MTIPTGTASLLCGYAWPLPGACPAPATYRISLSLDGRHAIDGVRCGRHLAFAVHAVRLTSTIAVTVTGLREEW